MKISIRKIGNSKGIILPQKVLQQCFIENDAEIEVKDNYIIISAPRKFEREGWEQAFKQMALNGDDQLVIPDMFDDEQIPDWTW